MAYKKAAEVDSWISQPDHGKAIILLYGPNYGLICVYAKNLISSLAFNPNDPFTVRRLDADEPRIGERLIEEVNTISLFSEKRLIWIRHTQAQKGIIESIRKLSVAPPPNTIIIIEAGDLRKSSALRTIVEKSENAIALPCYQDNPRDINALIADSIKNTGILLSSESRSWIQQNFGGDRLVNLSELEKIKIYAHGCHKIELSDIVSLMTDGLKPSGDEAINAILQGNLSKLDFIYERFIQAEGQAFFLIAVTTNQFQNLYAMKAEMNEDRKQKIEDIVAKAKPPVFFTRKRLIENALRAWPLTEISATLQNLQKTTLKMRCTPKLAQSIASETLLETAKKSYDFLKRS